MRLITYKEASKLLNVSAQTLRNWVDAGIFKDHTVHRVRYLDLDTLETLSDSINDVKEAELKLKQTYQELSQERCNLLYEKQDSETRRKFLKWIISSERVARFMSTIIDMMVVTDIIPSQREAEILKAVLKGETRTEVSERYGLSRERIRQLYEKTLRRAGDILPFVEGVQELKQLKAKVTQQEALISKLTAKLSAYEQLPSEDEMMTALLETKLADCSLSVRALNCLGSFDAYTIRDLVTLDKQKLFKARNMGKKTMKELEEFIISKGLTWEMYLKK